MVASKTEGVLTSDLPDGELGVTAHDGQRGHAGVLSALHEGGGEEAGGAHVAWLRVSLHHVLAHVLLNEGGDERLRPKTY